MTRIAPDGYTIMFASNSAMVAAVALRKQPTYDPLKDFTPISLVGRATVFFYVHPSVPAKTLKEFIAYAQANPGKLNYGTGNPLSILYNAQSRLDNMARALQVRDRHPTSLRPRAVGVPLHRHAVSREGWRTAVLH
jgi:tripartite-type tricarboxylate transporter receptor subunit TctC